MLCKIAEPDEIRQCFLQVHSSWPHAEDIEQHLMLRQASIQHQRAKWFVVKMGEQVVCSLGAYPMALQGPDGVRKARALGAVFTPEQNRRNGYAEKLIQWVMQYYADLAVENFILYSDVDPVYYQKCGFMALPSYRWQWAVDPLFLPKGIQLISVEVQPQDPGMLDCRYGLARSSFLARWVQDKQKSQLSLVRVCDLDSQLTGEWLLARFESGCYYYLEGNIQQSVVYWSRFQALINTHARQLSCTQVEGWWTAESSEPDQIMQKEIMPRQQEILMWASRQGSADPWAAHLPVQGFRVFLSEHV